jgi:hypothetical protein
MWKVRRSARLVHQYHKLICFKCAKKCFWRSVGCDRSDLIQFSNINDQLICSTPTRRQLRDVSQLVGRDESLGPLIVLYFQSSLDVWPIQPKPVLFTFVWSSSRLCRRVHTASQPWRTHQYSYISRDAVLSYSLQNNRDVSVRKEADVPVSLQFGRELALPRLIFVVFSFWGSRGGEYISVGTSG